MMCLHLLITCLTSIMWAPRLNSLEDLLVVFRAFHNDLGVALVGLRNNQVFIADLCTQSLNHVYSRTVQSRDPRTPDHIGYFILYHGAGPNRVARSVTRMQRGV